MFAFEIHFAPYILGTAHLVQAFGFSEQDARKLLGQSGLEGSAHLAGAWC